MNRKRVGRIRRRERHEAPTKQPGRGRRRRNDGSCIRLPPEHPGHQALVSKLIDDAQHPKCLAVTGLFSRAPPGRDHVQENHVPMPCFTAAQIRTRTVNLAYMPRYMFLILSSLPISSDEPDMTIEPDSST